MNKISGVNLVAELFCYWTEVNVSFSEVKLYMFNSISIVENDWKSIMMFNLSGLDVSSFFISLHTGFGLNLWQWCFWLIYYL